MELLIGSGIVALGIFILVKATGFPTLAGGYPGPGLFPQMLGILLILSGGVVVVQQVQEKAWPRWPRPLIQRERINALLVLLSVVAYLVLVEYGGFVLTVSLLLVGLMTSLGVRLRIGMLVGIGLALSTYLLFNKLLGVPLPRGLVEQWL